MISQRLDGVLTNKQVSGTQRCSKAAGNCKKRFRFDNDTAEPASHVLADINKHLLGTSAMHVGDLIRPPAAKSAACPFDMPRQASNNIQQSQHMTDSGHSDNFRHSF